MFFKRRLTTHSVCICRQAQFFHLVTDSLKRSHPHGWFDGCVAVRSRDTMQLEKGRLDNGKFFCYAALTGLQVNSYQQLNSTIATIGSCFCIRSPCNRASHQGVASFKVGIWQQRATNLTPIARPDLSETNIRKASDFRQPCCIRSTEHWGL